MISSHVARICELGGQTRIKVGRTGAAGRSPRNFHIFVISRTPNRPFQARLNTCSSVNGLPKWVWRLQIASFHAPPWLRDWWFPLISRNSLIFPQFSVIFLLSPLISHNFLNLLWFAVISRDFLWVPVINFLWCPVISCIMAKITRKSHEITWNHGEPPRRGR